MLKRFLTLLAVAALVCSVIPGTASAKKLVLKVQQAYSAPLPILGTGITWWAHALEEAAGGDVKVKIYEPGKLVKAFEILDSVSAGQVDAGVAGGVFWAGKLPAAPVFCSIPFGPEADEFMAWMLKGNGLKLYQELYDKNGYNVKVLPVAILVPETAGWFSKPIESVDDFKGLKMRFAGYGGKVMQKLGVSVTMMAPSELFPALEKGVLDATEFSMPAIDKRLGFHKVVKYNYFPGWHQQATMIDLYINKDKWNAMTPAQRKLIEMTSLASVMNSIAEGESMQGSIIKENIEKHGVINKYWSPEMLETFRATWEEVAAEMSEQDPYFKEAYADLKAFRADYKYWMKLGFLPRN